MGKKKAKRLPSANVVTRRFYEGEMTLRQLSALIRRAEKKGNFDLAVRYREIKEAR